MVADPEHQDPERHGPERIGLVHLRIPLVRPFATARASVTERHLVLVSFGVGDATGWGECAPYPGHTTETLDDAWAALRAAARRLIAGAPGAIGATTPPTVTAALDGARADLTARRWGRPLWASLGGSDRPIPAGAAIGLAEDPTSLLRAVEATAGTGYRHIKVKIARGRDVAYVGAVRRAFPDLGIGVDANGAYTRSEAEALVALDDLDIAYLEQPLAAGDLEGHRRLGTVLRTPICLDESVPSEAAALAAIERRSAPLLNLKPGRLGPDASIRVHGAAVAAGIGLRVGGLVESGIGRGHAIAVATMPGCTMPGDLADSARYFPEDVVDVPWQIDAGLLRPPSGAGIGVLPRPGALERFAVRTEVIG